MRCLYRERRYECGDYLEVDIFPVFAKQRGRRGKAKPTSETQQRLNEHNAEQKLLRILNANFTGEDIEIHLTYDNDRLPETQKRAEKDLQNYLRRIKRARRAAGLPEMKYVAVTEGGINGTRYHFHLTMSGGLDRDIMEELWGFGYANARKLQFNENGVEGLMRYVTKQFRAHKELLAFRKRWTASKNIVIPPPKDRDGRLSAKKVRELATVESESREPFERLYDGYVLSKVEPFFNDVNGGYYLHIRLYRSGTVFGQRRKRRRERNETERK